MKLAAVLCISSALFATSVASSDFSEVCDKLANMYGIMSKTVTSVAKSCNRPSGMCMAFRWSALEDYKVQLMEIRGQLGCNGQEASVSSVSSVCDSIDALPDSVATSLMDFFDSPEYSKIYKPMVEKVQTKAAELSSSLAEKIC